MTILKGINAAVSFLLELVMLAALAYWGFQTGESTLVKLVLGIGAPLIAIVIWGIYNAPRSARRLPRVPRILLSLLLFALAAFALAVAGQPTLAIVFIVVALVNQGLIYVWKQ